MKWLENLINIWKKKNMIVKSESGVENAGFEMDEVDLGKPPTGW